MGAPFEDTETPPLRSIAGGAEVLPEWQVWPSEEDLEAETVGQRERGFHASLPNDPCPPEMVAVHLVFCIVIAFVALAGLLWG